MIAHSQAGISDAVSVFLVLLAYAAGYSVAYFNHVWVDRYRRR